MTPGPQTDVELFANLILLGYEDSAAQQITNSAIADGQVADTNMGTEKRAGGKVSGEVIGPEPSRDDFPAGLMGDLAYGQALSAWRRAHSRTIGPIPRAELVDLSPQMEESQRIDAEANRLLQTITLENFDEVRAQLPDVLYVAGKEVNTDQYLSPDRFGKDALQALKDGAVGSVLDTHLQRLEDHLSFMRRASAGGQVSFDTFTESRRPETVVVERPRPVDITPQQIAEVERHREAGLVVPYYLQRVYSRHGSVCF